MEEREDAEKEVVNVRNDMAILRCAVVAMVFGEFHDTIDQVQVEPKARQPFFEFAKTEPVGALVGAASPSLCSGGGSCSAVDGTRHRRVSNDVHVFGRKLR